MQDLETEIKSLISQSFQSRFSFISIPEETWHPLTDVYETSKEIIVKMELPGVEARGIQINLDHKKLIVQGVRKDPCQNEKVSYHRMEISYGPFRKVILLPVSVKVRDAKATYRNGFLEIRLPFASEPSSELMVINIE